MGLPHESGGKPHEWRPRARSCLAKRPRGQYVDQHDDVGRATVVGHQVDQNLHNYVGELQCVCGSYHTGMRCVGLLLGREEEEPEFDAQVRIALLGPPSRCMEYLTRNRNLRPSFVGSPQIYPLVISLGIIAQGIVFAVAQAKGLETLQIEGCVPVSQMVMPGKLISCEVFRVVANTYQLRSSCPSSNLFSVLKRHSVRFSEITFQNDENG